VPDPYTQKSDIYSFGVVLYELTTGSLPYAQKEQDMVWYFFNHPSPPPPISLIFYVSQNFALFFTNSFKILYLVGFGRLKPNPDDARKDTPVAVKNLIAKCCEYDRNKRLNFVEVRFIFIFCGLVISIRSVRSCLVFDASLFIFLVTRVARKIKLFI
jgi:serine/threonine protein kinase